MLRGKPNRASARICQPTRHLDDEGTIARIKKGREGEEEGRDDCRRSQNSRGWSLGEPDFISKTREGLGLSTADEGAIFYRCFVIPTNFKEDCYVTAWNCRPGKQGRFHHVIVDATPRAGARELEADEHGPGVHDFRLRGFRSNGQIGGWAPGKGSSRNGGGGHRQKKR